jgi:hypothetical protein
VIYVGDITLGKRVAYFDGYDSAAVQQFLTKYPNLPAKPIERSGFFTVAANIPLPVGAKRSRDCTGMGRIETAHKAGP